MNFNLTCDTEQLSDGLILLSESFPITLSGIGDTYSLTPVKTDEKLLKISVRDKNITVTYTEKVHFFRGVGIAMEHIGYGETDFEICETPRFTLNGSMYDIAQGNAVMDLKKVKEILRRHAIMGLNTFMLYCEDNYEVEGYPYFGYMRGRYSQKNIKEIDDYAYTLGIELIPCIQTLAHLKDALRWPAYDGMRMDSDALLIGEPRVYEFIDAIVAAASKNVRSKRIHIGMDESMNLGEGEYLKKNGYHDPFDVMLEHLNKVREIVLKHGLRPMIWSDMFFSVASSDGYYYHSDIQIPQRVLDAYPKDVQLVYWDYYRDDRDFYHNYIQKHKEFGVKPVFAGGVHTWYSIAPFVHASIDHTVAALEVCVEEQIDEVFCTVWGDDNTEAHIDTAILGVALFAELGFKGKYDEQDFKKRYRFCTGMDFDKMMALGDLDALPELNHDGRPDKIFSKTFMWLDIMTGFNDNMFEGRYEEIEEHYRKSAALYRGFQTENPEYKNLYRYYELVARALEYKASIGYRLICAYREGDKIELGALVGRIRELKARVCQLHNFHREDWYSINKPFGFEVFDLRYATVEARCDSAIFRINEYLAGDIQKIEELAAPRLASQNMDAALFTNAYGRLFSASRATFI